MFIFGAGFVGSYVARRLITDGWDVSGTCMSVDRKRELEEMGMEAAYVFDANEDSLEFLCTLQQSTHALISIPPTLGIGDSLLYLQEDLRRILSCGSLEWLCYLSTTSVYGNCGGEFVDENCPVNPSTDSAKSRLEAEKGWLDLGRDLNVNSFVFRLGGIYGPGRSALDTIMSGKSLSEAQKQRGTKLYTARVHVADIYQALKASFEVPYSGSIYNIVDDDPAPRDEVFSFAQSLIAESSVFIADPEEADNKGQRSPMVNEKRVSNARLKNELGVHLLYPTYKLGLKSILESWESADQDCTSCS